MVLYILIFTTAYTIKSLKQNVKMDFMRPLRRYLKLHAGGPGLKFWPTDRLLCMSFCGLP
jgi:hypothetical protein